MWEHLKFKHPFTCIVAGPTSGEKTSFCIKLLQNLDSLCTESRFKGGIMWCYSEATDVPRQELDKLGLNITYQEGLPETYDNAQGGPSLIVLDDLLNEVLVKTCVICSLNVVITGILTCYSSRRTYFIKEQTAGTYP